MKTDRTAATAGVGAREGSGVPRSTGRSPTPRHDRPERPARLKGVAPARSRA